MDMQEKLAKARRIAALAERYEGSPDCRDRAFDAVMENENCDEKETAHRLAMEATYP
jgi:hypothetical protein